MHGQLQEASLPLHPHSLLSHSPPVAPKPPRTPIPLMAKLSVVVALLLLAVGARAGSDSDKCALEFSDPCEQVRPPARRAPLAA